MEQQLSSAISTASAQAILTASVSTSLGQQLQLHHQKTVFTRSLTLGPQSPASRPEDLRVKPWYAVDEKASLSKDSPPAKIMTPGGDQSSYPVYQSYELDGNNPKEFMSRAPDVASSRTSSIESENQRASVPRKAYMDLSDAIALLDETCPNPETSPQMTPRTPRTPLTPHPRNKRARSKSSDNSSNYSSEKLNEKPSEAIKSQEKERIRPFLKKIGISMTEDRPLLAKFTPKIIGKPYLEKIGPSRAVDKPFLEKIGSSRTLDKFTFEAPKADKKKEVDIGNKRTIIEEVEKKSSKERRDEIRGFSTGERRKSGKNFLSKMYSFETEDLEDTSSVMKVPHRDPLRGASLDDVLDSGPSSMPRINELCAMTNSDIETPCASVAELVRCRVTTSEEIISSNSCLNSPMEVATWGTCAREKEVSKKDNRGTISDSEVAFKENKSNKSIPNSPTKRMHSETPEKVIVVYNELDKVKNGRQTSEDILDKRKSRHDQFERRGTSSDNLTKERVATPVFAEIGGSNINGKGSNTSVVSTTSSVKQLHDRFESQEIFTETYADFKRRTQGNFHTSNALKRLVVREKTISTALDLSTSSKDSILEQKKYEISPKVRSKSAENDRQRNRERLEIHNSRARTRSVLRKQQGIDHSNDPNEVNNPQIDSHQRRKIVHEPSQETLDLLSELQKVKSSLKTPSIDKTYETDNAMELKPLPKRILLTDKEFCLSIERENSIRRPSRANTIESKPDESLRIGNAVEKSNESKSSGPALFEKRCLSLDYADDEKSIPQKTEAQVLSTASAKNLLSGNVPQSTEIELIKCGSKSYSSDVLNSPSLEIVEKIISGVSVEKEVKKIETEMKNSKQERANNIMRKFEDTHLVNDEIRKSKEERNPKKYELCNALRPSEKIEKIDTTEDRRDETYEKAEQLSRANHCSEVDSANREFQISPKKRNQCQGHTGDSSEVASPKATPFRMKKRLGRISVEETVKQESFTVNKIDCKEAAVQKRAKCLPL